MIHPSFPPAPSSSTGDLSYNQTSTSSRQASIRAVNPKMDREHLYSKLQEYEAKQNEKRVLKPSGYAYRALKILKFSQATCFMCEKSLHTPQGFGDHVTVCDPEDNLKTVVPLELVLSDDDEG